MLAVNCLIPTTGWAVNEWILSDLVEDSTKGIHCVFGTCVQGWCMYYVKVGEYH